MRLLIILSVIFFSSSLCGQSYMTKTTAGSKAMKPYRKANAHRVNKFDAKAIEEYSKAIAICPSFIDAYLERGDTYIGLKEDEKAESDLLKAIALDPHYKPKALFVLAALQWKMDKYDDVVKHAQMLLDSEYKSKVVREKCEDLVTQATFAREAVKNPLPFAPVRMPSGINTDTNHEYLPSFTADEEQIIFCRVVDGQEDFYMSEMQDGEWLPAVPITNINTSGNEAAHAVTASGDYIVFTACDRREGFGSCDLYSAEKINGKWTAPKNMGSGINSTAWDSQPTLSGNGKYLFFTSKRKGGLGASDIYVCKRFDDGVWSKPVNLGDKVNTKHEEESPFLHPDGKTLYFMSKGYPGMGDYDLFMVRQEQPFKWGEVKNLGYPINTKGHEGALFVSLDGRTGYYSRSEEKTLTDIYSFEMPESIRPDPVTYVKGTVTDASTKKPIQANVLLYPSNNPEEETRVMTDADGTFLLALPIGVDYSLTVDQKGYTFYSDRFELSEGQSIAEPFLLDIPLQELQIIVANTPSTPTAEVIKPKPIILKNVFFETASAELRPESFIELDKLYQLLVETPSIRIQVNGHTDDVGDDESNQTLSENRAKSVYQYLLGRGIESSRVLYKGYGETQFIADNATDEGRAQNRRTEFVILN